MTERGLLVPDAEGKFRFQGVKEQEIRPILSYERDTGVVLFNVNMLLRDYRRKMRDVMLQTTDGMIMGVVITSVAMGPEEIRKLEEKR